MKTKIIILICTVVLSIGSVMAINSYAAERKQDIVRSSLPIVLKVHENYVAAYQGDEIIEIFEDVVYNALPEYDRNALKRGLEFENMNEVYSAVEDFDG